MITKTAGYNLMLNWTKTLTPPNLMSLTEWALKAGKYKLNLHFHKSKLLCFQVPIRKVRAISTVWNVTITAPIPTKLLPTGGSIRSWTASWPRALRSSLPPSIVQLQAAATTESRPITTAESVNTQSSASPRWRLTSTDTWMKIGRQTETQVRRGPLKRWAVIRRTDAGYNLPNRNLRTRLVLWESLLEQSQVDEVKIQFKVHFLTGCKQGEQSSDSNTSLMWSDDPEMSIFTTLR